jgi:sterol desaturase/sphingolipid hydroxylase (fatty acid hydroxylase superfamily)
LLVGGGTAVAAIAINYGVPHWLVLPLVAGPSAFVIIILERRVAFATVWQDSHGDVPADLCHLTVSSSLAFAFLCLFFTPQEDNFRQNCPDCLNWLAFWPKSWPLLLQIGFGLVLGEFGTYWLHRLQHGTNLLWRLHAVHHSAERLYWLNSSRNHPIDVMLIVAITVIPSYIIGAPKTVITLVLVFGAIHLMLQHSNIDMRLGPLNWIFSMSEVHRWHHSRRLAESNANYGLVLLIWDLVFGTFYYPRYRSPSIDIGLADRTDFPSSYWGQFTSPFNSRLWNDEARGQSSNAETLNDNVSLVAQSEPEVGFRAANAAHTIGRDHSERTSGTPMQASLEAATGSRDIYAVASGQGGSQGFVRHEGFGMVFRAKPLRSRRAISK